MKLVQMDLWAANAFVRQHHRHLTAKKAHRFSLGVEKNGVLVGVAVVGLPGLALHSRTRVEVARLCTDGTPNACSFLLGACARAAKALGYQRIYTYTLPEEGGISLAAAGWKKDGETSGKSGWADFGKYRGYENQGTANVTQGVKYRWVRDLSPAYDLAPYPASFPHPDKRTLFFWRHQEWLRKQGMPHATPQTPLHERKLREAREGDGE